LPETEAVVVVAAHSRDSVFVGLKSGRVFRVELVGFAARELFVLRAITALACQGQELLAGTTSHGEVGTWQEGTLRTESLATGAALRGMLWEPGGPMCVVGEYDERTGVLLVSNDAGWKPQPLNGAPGVLAIASDGAGRRLLCGRRGYSAHWERESVMAIDTHTEHPLRAALVGRSGSWWIGGGGWAGSMPILLRGHENSAVTVLSAAGNRVIVGLAEDSRGTLWIAENRSDGQAWHGVLLRLRETSAEVVDEYRGVRLFGISCILDRLILHGTSGFLAWADL
jgi:hypothetical protein